MNGMTFTDALRSISKLAEPVEKSGGFAGWLEHLGSFVVDVLEGRAVDQVVHATKVVSKPPRHLARYVDHYVGFDPDVEHPSGARGAHLFRFGTVGQRDDFLQATGGDDARAVLRKFDPEQPRDDAGKWTSGGGTSWASYAAAAQADFDHGPVYRPLNDACKHMAEKIFPQGFDVTANAPNTYEDLVSHYAKTGRMAVWNGASDKTIFGDDQANYAFRAWHDSCHLRGMHPFTPEGEEGAFEEMVSDVHKEYGDTPDSKKMIGLLHEEIIGQLDYTKFHAGQFPVDQRSFAQAYLKDPEGAVRMTFKAAVAAALAQAQAGWGRLRDVGRVVEPSLLARLVAGRLRHAGLRKYNEDQLRDTDGRWTSGASGDSPEADASRSIAEHLGQSIDDDVAYERMATNLNAEHGAQAGVGVAFASPSITDKTLPEAVTDLGGQRHQLFERAVREVDDSMGITGEQHGVIGAWADGAENSTMLEVPGHADYGAIKTAAAMKGYLGQQKAVLVFKSELDGPHALYDMTVPGGQIGQVHDDLLKAGVPFHTLVPSASGTRALVVDTDGTLGKNVGDFAIAHHTVATRSTGNAEFIGDDQGTGSDAEQRQRARTAYEGVIQADGASRYRGRSVSSIWQGLRDRWGSQLDAVKRGWLIAKAAGVATDLYARRNLANAAQLHAWAQSAGIPNLVPPDEMHVTQVYSRKPVRLAARKDVVIASGGERSIAPLGDKGAVVLHFASPELQARHAEAMAAGASHDFPKYLTHVTLSYDAGGKDIASIEPPAFPLVFGPEVHESINDSWAEDKGLRKGATLTFAGALALLG